MATRSQMMASRGRRQQRFQTRLEWYGERLRNNLNIGLEARMKIASQLLRDKVVMNISVPVVKEIRNGKTVVTERSAPGEFPRADTTRLMKDIFYDVKTRGDQLVGIVGTTLDYGLYLETSPRLNRAFLVPTLDEIQPQLRNVFLSRRPPIPGQNEGPG